MEHTTHINSGGISDLKIVPLSHRGEKRETSFGIANFRPGLDSG
jgi:hypothetical protein